MGRHIRLFLFFLSPIFIACGLGQSALELPPERPFGGIRAQLDPTLQGTDARIDLYVLERGEKKQLLTSTKFSNEGRVEIPVQAKSQVFLAEIYNLDYKSPLNQTTETVSADHPLQILIPFESGETSEVNFNILVQLPSALTRYYLKNDIEFHAANEKAVQEFRALFDFPLSKVSTVDATTMLDAQTPVAARTLTTLHDAIDLMTQQFKPTLPDGQVTDRNLSLLRTMMSDLLADGQMNGLSADPQASSPQQLALGELKLSGSHYRAAISQFSIAAESRRLPTTSPLYTETKDYWHRFANTASAVLPPDNDDSNVFQPNLFSVDRDGSFFSGVAKFRIGVNSVSPVEKIQFTLDDRDIGFATTVASPEIEFDTTTVSDGQHQLGIIATNASGVASSIQIAINIDNTRPIVNIRSSLINNKLTFPIDGTYVENGAGIETISVNGHDATVNGDGTWSVTMNIPPGTTPLQVAIRDRLGNQNNIETNAIVDNVTPIIDSLNLHGRADFDSSPVQTDRIYDINYIYPIRLSTQKLSLPGVVLSRERLDASNIPYFAFKVFDPEASGVATSLEDMDVRLRYQVNGKTLFENHSLSPNNGEFLIPLLVETLGSQWLDSLRSDQHQLTVFVTDQAGNRGMKLFQFRGVFRVEPFLPLNVQPIVNSTFATTAFTDRKSLHDRDIAAIQYTLVNPTHFPLFARFLENYRHHLQTTMEQVQRENRARLISTEQWQAVPVDIFNPCPSPPQENEWIAIDTVENYNGSSWQTLTPKTTIASYQQIITDNPEAPATTPWILADDTDQKHFAEQPISIGGQILNYHYDSRIKVNNILRPTQIFEWSLTQDGLPVDVKTCLPINRFRQRVQYNYEIETGYPRNTFSEVNEGDDFNTSGWRVLDVDSNPINPNDGWYRLEPGQRITVEKIVHTPKRVVHNDTIVTTPNAITSYTAQLYDKSLQWSIQRALKLQFRYAPTTVDVNAMPTTEIDSPEGIDDFVLER